MHDVIVLSCSVIMMVFLSLTEDNRKTQVCLMKVI